MIKGNNDDCLFMVFIYNVIVASLSEVKVVCFSYFVMLKHSHLNKPKHFSTNLIQISGISKQKHK